MDHGDLLTIERVCGHERVASKKRALELLAEMIASGAPQLTTTEVFAGLLQRERLGSTGLGSGVALPHGRLPGVSEALGAFLRLDVGIDFDAPDGGPVDLLFGLVVPEQSTEAHLAMLARLAELFRDAAMVQALRGAADEQALLTLIRAWRPTMTAS